MTQTKALALAFALVLAAPLPALAQCGDGALAPTEGCDDGNVVAGDGCSASCAIETGFACRTQDHLDIVNPSFETPFPGLGGGWTIVPLTTVDRISGGCWSPAGDATFSVDMNGSNKGQIFQDVLTTIGTHYVVTLLGNANCVETGGTPCSVTCSKTLTMSVSDTLDLTGTPFATAGYNLFGGPTTVAWQPVRFEFTARSLSTRLTFTGSDPSFAGPMIDRIAIPASVCDATTCGDGTVGAGELCDDHNTTSGDGCSSSCTVEVGFMCTVPGAACTSMCGDGIKVASEECDDGNVTPSDGCSATCAIEAGYGCVVDPFTNQSVCMMTCGNGVLDAGEECDDHNAVDDDLCSNRCLRGPGVACTASPQCAFGLCTILLCAGCYDTAAAGGVDFGCIAAAPACDTTTVIPTCVGCLADADCAATDMCSAAHVCVSRVDAGMDGGIDGGSDAGIDAGADAGIDGGIDGGSDAGIDAGADGGSDAGFDAGIVVTPDAGRDGGPDAGRDASASDAGSDASPDASVRTGGVSGGACACTIGAPPRGTPWRLVLALGALVLGVRRKLRQRRASRATRRA